MVTCKKGIEVKVFTVDQYVEKSLKCILTKFELSTSSRFKDITVQSQKSFFFHFRVDISSILCQRRLTFEKLAYIYMKNRKFTILTLHFVLKTQCS